MNNAVVRCGNPRLSNMLVERLSRIDFINQVEVIDQAGGFSLKLPIGVGAEQAAVMSQACRPLRLPIEMSEASVKNIEISVGEPGGRIRMKLLYREGTHGRMVASYLADMGFHVEEQADQVVTEDCLFTPIASNSGIIDLALFALQQAGVANPRIIEAFPPFSGRFAVSVADPGCFDRELEIEIHAEKKPISLQLPEGFKMKLCGPSRYETPVLELGPLVLKGFDNRRAQLVELLRAWFDGACKKDSDRAFRIDESSHIFSARAKIVLHLPPCIEVKSHNEAAAIAQGLRSLHRRDYCRVRNVDLVLLSPVDQLPINLINRLNSMGFRSFVIGQHRGSANGGSFLQGDFDAHPRVARLIRHAARPSGITISTYESCGNDKMRVVLKPPSDSCR